MVATVAMLGCLVAHVTTLRRNCELVKVWPLFGDGLPFPFSSEFSPAQWTQWFRNFALHFFWDCQCTQSLVILEWNKESLAELEWLELS